MTLDHQNRRKLAPWLLLFVLILFPVAGWADYEEATLKDFADIHSGPGDEFYVVQDGEEGNSFPVLEKKGNWIKVRLPTGTGWINKSKVELSEVDGDLPPGAEEESSSGEAKEPEPEEAKKDMLDAVVRTKDAKLFSEPATTSVVVKKVPKGTHLEVLEKSDDGAFLKVRHDGPTAWVRASSVTLVGQPAGAEAKIPTKQASKPAAGRTEPKRAREALHRELRLWVGVGEARLGQSWKTNAAGNYRYGNYMPPPSYEVSTAGPSLELGAGYWILPNLGLSATGRLVGAYKGLELTDTRYTAEAVRLTMATYSMAAAGEYRLPLTDSGAYVQARLGYRYFKLAWDEAQPPPAAIENIAYAPVYWSTSYHGPLIGLGGVYPFNTWLNLELGGDVVPYGFASNNVTGGTTKTPSGNVDHAWGMNLGATLSFVVYAGPPTIAAEIRFFWDYYASKFTVPAGGRAIRGLPPYLSYTQAEASEQDIGGAVTATIRFE